MSPQLPPTYSQLRSSPRLDLASASPIPAPMTLYLEPTNVCNFSCVQCPESFPDYSQLAGYYGKMPFEMYEKIIADLGAFGRIKSLKLYFEGEPLLHPDLGRMISAARAADVAERIEVTSNGSMLTEKKALELIEAGLDYLQVSIYSMEDEGHLRVTGAAKFSPAKILSNVKAMRALRDSLGRATPFIYAKLMYNSPADKALFTAAYAGVADEVGVDFRHNWNGSVDRGLVSIQYDVPREEIEAALRHKKQACPFPFYLMAVKSNGDVSACCVDWNGLTNIGNVRDSSLSEIWNGDKLNNLRKAHLGGRRAEIEGCKNCDALYTLPDSLESLSEADYDTRVARRT